MASKDTPPGAFEHAEGCARSLPYSSPLFRSLDPEHCGRCWWLNSLLDDARDRRIAKREACKRELVSVLDKLPHNARGHSWSSLKAMPGLGGQELLPVLRELIEDKIIAEHVVSGVKRYALKGK